MKRVQKNPTLESKLHWMKNLRGADLRPSELNVLVMLLTYSDKNRDNAHPGVAVLVEDTGLARSTVIEALKSLETKGWILKTDQGGNEYGKGKANVYSIRTPAVIHKGSPGEPLKGPVSRTLQAVEGSDLQGKGPIAGPQGSDLQGFKGPAGRTPSGHSSNPNPIRSSSIHSEGRPSGPPGVRSPGAAGPWHYDENGYLTDESYDRLLDIVGAVDGVEESVIDGMLANGAHPQAVINTINARRTA